ncbi:MAG: response regulator [Candidatus Nitrosopolaris sp.]|jgi:CheY-like chemotaxis protein
MAAKVECLTLGLTTIKTLSEIQISHFIACKNYEEKITTIHTCKIYNDVVTKERETNQQKVHENKRKRILLVDDEYDINLATKVVLDENGFKVDSYTDPSEALENFTSHLYDLVILDVKMPEMDGFYLYEKIKKLDDNVKICFLTATDDAYYQILKRNYPAINEDCIIHKPVDNESLLRRIKSIL